MTLSARAKPRFETRRAASKSGVLTPCLLAALAMAAHLVLSTGFGHVHLDGAGHAVFHQHGNLGAHRHAEEGEDPHHEDPRDGDDDGSGFRRGLRTIPAGAAPALQHGVSLEALSAPLSPFASAELPTLEPDLAAPLLSVGGPRGPPRAAAAVHGLVSS